AHRDTDVRYQPLADPDACLSWPDAGADTEIVEDRDQDTLQAIEIFLDAHSEPPQRQDRIDRKLAGQMQEAAAAAVDRGHRPAPGLQFVALEQDVAMTALPADADQGRVLTEDEGSAIAPVGDLPDQVMLQAEAILIIELAEQVDVQGREFRILLQQV